MSPVKSKESYAFLFFVLHGGVQSKHERLPGSAATNGSI